MGSGKGRRTSVLASAQRRETFDGVASELTPASSCDLGSLSPRFSAGGGENFVFPLIFLAQGAFYRCNLGVKTKDTVFASESVRRAWTHRTRRSDRDSSFQIIE
jgi:hypothetical protein